WVALNPVRTIISTGIRSRMQAVGEEGRAAIGVALGLVVVLFTSGFVGGLVTANRVRGHITTPVGISIGLAVQLLFLLYVYVPGKKAHQEGETGDIRQAPAVAPVA